MDTSSVKTSIKRKGQGVVSLNHIQELVMTDIFESEMLGFEWSDNLIMAMYTYIHMYIRQGSNCRYVFFYLQK